MKKARFAVYVLIAVISAYAFTACGGGGGGGGPTGRVLTLSDTGQTECYSVIDNSVASCDGTGQDGEFSINPMAFTNNIDGTLTTDSLTGLMWNAVSDSTRYNWYEASGIANSTYNPGSSVSICGDLSLGGYNDWRLPEVSELMGIMNYGASNAAPDEDYFSSAESTFHWTSITQSDNPERAWVIWIGSGIVAMQDNMTGYPVKCVRGESASAAGFTNNMDGTVTDNATGLIWEQIYEVSLIPWKDALDYCNGLVLADKDDWRLPNIKELRSVVDVTRFSPSIDSEYFPGVTYSSKGFWSSTTTVSVNGSAWMVDFRRGSAMSYDKNMYGYFARCVR